MRERQWAQVTVSKQYREHAFCKHCPRLRTAVESKSIERYNELYGEAPFEKGGGGGGTFFRLEVFAFDEGRTHF